MQLINKEPPFNFRNIMIIQISFDFLSKYNVYNKTYKQQYK